MERPSTRCANKPTRTTVGCLIAAGRCTAAPWQALVYLLASIATVSCNGPNQPTTASLDKTFTLNYGAVASIQGENLQVGFEQVLSDSRCPRNTQCIVAGDATIRLWLSKPPRGKEERDLNTARATSATYDAYQIALTSLAPSPEVGSAIPPSDYVATLVVSRTP